MREREVLKWLRKEVPHAGDDCAILPFHKSNLVFTIDMLWERADFPKGVTPYTIGWRAVAVSLSDIAAMGAKPLGIVMALGTPVFEKIFLDGVLQGGLACCQEAGAPYVGGDLSKHSELTLVSSAIGEAAKPILRSGAKAGELVCMTGELGRTAAALKLFSNKKFDAANDLFCFTPRIREGLALAPFATSMMDISDGLARSLHQMSEAGGCGFKIALEQIPVLAEVERLAKNRSEWREMALHTGEDFELLFTIAEKNLRAAKKAASFCVIGEVVESGVWLVTNKRISKLPNRGFEH